VSVNINIFDTQHPATNITTHREKKQKKQQIFSSVKLKVRGGIFF